MAREGANLIQQIGVQSVAGTPVAATKRFASIAIDVGADIVTKQFRSHGAKQVTTSILHKNMSSGRFEGPLSYNELIYVLAGLASTTVNTVTGVSTWTHSPSPIGADSFKYYTLEQGDDEDTEQYKDLQFTSLDISWGLEDVMMSGAVFAKTKATLGSLSGGVSILAERPVSARDITIYADTTFGGIGVTALTDPFDAKLSLGEKFSPKWVLNKTQTSYKEPFERISDKTFTITIEAGSQARTLLSDLLAGNGRFFRVKAEDGEIPSSTPSTNFLIQFDFYAKLSQVREIKDYQDALFAYELTFVLIQEANLNAPYTAIVKNNLTAL